MNVADAIELNDNLLKLIAHKAVNKCHYVFGEGFGPDAITHKNIFTESDFLEVLEETLELQRYDRYAAKLILCGRDWVVKFNEYSWQIVD